MPLALRGKEWLVLLTSSLKGKGVRMKDKQNKLQVGHLFGHFPIALKIYAFF